MISLGIESTAHTFGAGVIDDDSHVLSNVRDSYTTTEGGIHPSEAKAHHQKAADKVIAQALRAAQISIDDVDVVSFSQGPGLPPCLVVGKEKAKEIAARYSKPIVGVNHCVAHLEIGKALTDAKDPVLLYVSGANTQVIAFEGGKYRIFGETLDQGVGNALDQFARHAGLGFPGGPKIAEAALKGKEFIELPYSVKGMDISVSGLLTNVKQKLDSKRFQFEDIAFSFQETVFAMLIEVAERAMAHCGKKELLLGGGVCCNKRLQEMSGLMCAQRGASCFIPPNDVMVDNGVMIAWLGLVMRNAGISDDPVNVDIRPKERTDDVDAVWV